jgi:hypothetical protein
MILKATSQLKGHQKKLEEHIIFLLDLTIHIKFIQIIDMPWFRFNKVQEVVWNHK